MISKFFIDRPKFAFVISIVIMIAGGIALWVLPIAEFPPISPPQVSVTASYPGANAETVANTVLAPLEQRINGVKHMLYMQSKAGNDGSATINITFDVGTDPEMNTVNTQTRVAQATPMLPEEVIKQGVVVKEQSTNMLMVVTLTAKDDKYDGIFLSNFMSLNVLDELARIDGVADAKILGAMDYSMRVWLDPNRMASLDLNPSDVISAIQEQNAQVAAGQVGGPPSPANQKFQFTVQTLGRLSNVDEFNNIIIKAKPDGAYIRLKDVAKVDLGAYSYASFGQVNGHPSANLAIYQLPEANALTIAKAVNQKISELSKRFPKDLHLNTEITYDTTNYVNISIHEVMETLIIAVILVVLVTFLFLQCWRTTLIPTIAIPVSLIGTFAFMLGLGYSINTVTLFALILAIGLVVDDAIVVVENVNRIITEEGLNPYDATVKSMEQVTGPIIATTLVLFAVFVPVAFVPGISGELYRQFAVTITVSVLISAVNALTLSPALCVTLLKGEAESNFFIFTWFNKIFDKILNFYSKSVHFTLKHVKLVVIGFLLILGTSYFVYSQLPTGFIPSEDRGVFLINVQLPDGASLDRTTKVVDKMVHILEKTPGIKYVTTVPGYSLLSGTASSDVALGICMLDNWTKREGPGLSLDEILVKVNQEFMQIPEADIFAFNIPPIDGLGTTGGFEYVLQAVTNSNTKDLAAVMSNLITQANNEPSLQRTYSTFRSDLPQIYLNIDRDKVKKMGVQLGELFNTLQTYLGSTYINQFNKYGKVYKVLAQADTDYRSTEQDIFKLYVRNADGNMIPLRTMVNAKTILGPSYVQRYNMLTSATINGNANPGYSSGDTIKAMERLSKNLPDGYSHSWTGTAYQEILAGNIVVYIFLLALIFIYLFLVAQYESWMISFAVMLAVPIACFGAIMGLWSTGIENNIYSQIGIVLLFGLATKTAILIVEFAKKQHDEGGDSAYEAAIKAGKIRFRAVVMTSIAFILGVFPLVIATGAGAAGRRSIGTTVFGGMISATILGTLLTPAFYMIIQNIVNKNKKKKEAKNVKNVK